MKPKYRYPSADKDKIPAALLEFYKEADGFFVLDIDGAGDAAALNGKIDEFRRNNQTARRDLEEVAAAATGKTADEFKGVEKATIISEIATAIDAQAKAGSAKSKADVEAASAAQIEAIKTAHSREVAKLTQERDTGRKELEKLKIDNAVIQEADKLGLRPEAHADAMARARSVFVLDENGVPVARNPDGTQLFDTTTGAALTVAGWTKQLSEKAAHLFKSSEGSGSEGGAGGGGGGGGPKAPGVPSGVNPWKQETWNVTQQAAIYKAGKPRAIRLAAEAGKKIS